MRLISTTVTPQGNGYNRLAGVVEYADSSHDTYWFDIPESYAPSTSGNPWVACLLPLAVTIGEDIEVPLPVDQNILEGVAGLTRLWRSWYPDLRKVVIHAQIAPITETPTESMAFFSAGVDSYFTVLRNPVKHFVNVLGFDMPLSNEPAFRVHCERLATSANRLGAELIAIRTNIRQTRWKTCQWELLGVGPALATIGLILEKRFATVLIPASLDLGNTYPAGSHPLSDPLFSTSKTRVVCDGATHTRVEKIAMIVENEVVRQSLHVCFRGHDGLGQDDRNCGHCEKCYRTMAVLDILGKLDKCVQFDASAFAVRDLSRVLIETTALGEFYREIQELALAYGRHDVFNAIDAGFRRSQWVGKLQLLHRLPVFWRVGAAIDREVRKTSPS